MGMSFGKRFVRLLYPSYRTRGLLIHILQVTSTPKISPVTSHTTQIIQENGNRDNETWSTYPILYTLTSRYMAVDAILQNQIRQISKESLETVI